MDPELPKWMDPRRAAEIARLRALGYTQKEIAQELDISQQTVSRYLHGINEAAEEADSLEDFLFGLLLVGLGTAAMFALFRAFQGQGGGARF